MALYAAARLEGLRSKHRLKHFALRARLYLKAIRSAFEELQMLLRNISYRSDVMQYVAGGWFSVRFSLGSRAGRP